MGGWWRRWSARRAAEWLANPLLMKMHFPVRIELLENRISPATLIWDGSFSDKWSDAANWSTNHVPADGDTLVFPDAAAQKTNTNDVPGLDLKAIQLNGLNYVISGNSITLSAGLTSSTPAGTPNDA